jgi:GT2 family glycosyltransferase
MRQGLMLAKATKNYLKRVAEAILTVSVHKDAFLASPNGYLTAVKSRIKRKRKRAQNQFALLLSQSPHAYALWILRTEKKSWLASSPKPAKPIIAIVDTRAFALERDLGRHLETTINSLSSEGLSTIVIGSSETPDLTAAGDAIDWTLGAWLLPLSPGDRIAPGTADAYRAAMEAPGNSDTSLLYADDDCVDRAGRRNKPYFKPDWNAELFQHHDYLTGACVLRVKRKHWSALQDAPDWSMQLTRGIVEAGAIPQHLRQMLHHRRHRPTPRVPASPMAIVADLPPLSVIVPTRNRVDLLRTCIDGVAKADYPDVEVIIVDNDSDDVDTLDYLAALDPARYHLLRHAGAFNYSAINNRAVAQARGRLLCLLNNDIETTDQAWLAILATQALRPEVGAVGARLLYPDGRIQHAGVVVGVGNAAGHAHRFLQPEEDGYFHRHSLPQFTMAVTAACLVVAREKFLAVGGLNEADFPVAFNDVDLCLRLNRRGWQSLYEPRATLIHHESVSRGLDLDPVGAARFASELAQLQRLWQTGEIIDPYHHPYLSRASERFVVAL